MNATLATIVGSALVLISSVGAVTALQGRSRRGAGRVALAVAWLSLGMAGLSFLAYVLIPDVPAVFLLGVVVVGSGLAIATALGVLRLRERAGARRRDAALGLPPLPVMPPRALVLSSVGLVSLTLCTALIGSWMLGAAASAGVPVVQIVPGLIANTALATPLMWLALSAVASARLRRCAADAESLRLGVELRVADAEAVAYRDGFASGREDGYRHAAFGSTWE